MTPWNSVDEVFLDDVKDEVIKARTKFPGNHLMLGALVEEVGELAQALLKVSAGKWPPERIIEEAIQVAAMALRIATEGDRSFQIHDYREPD